MDTNTNYAIQAHVEKFLAKLSDREREALQRKFADNPQGVAGALAEIATNIAMEQAA